MEQVNWAPEHSDALRDYLVRGMAYSEIVEAINAKFNTNYSRNAAIGRARRMGLAGPALPDVPQRIQPWLGGSSAQRAAEPRLPAFHWPLPLFDEVKLPKLRCVEIEPRHLSLVDLGQEDCRYPFGGDVEGEPITFCGHPRQPGASYCTPHFHLSRNPDLAQESPVSAAWLRLFEMA